METNPSMGNDAPDHYVPEELHDSLPDMNTSDSGAISGLSREEINDHNKISITIHDQYAPVIVFFGPPACGKTMTLVRLARYLCEELNYTVVPDTAFRPEYDTNYQKMCENFNDVIYSSRAAESTSNMSFMLVRVLDERGNLVAQLLEAPGELYFNPSNANEPNVDFPRPVKVIANSNQRKIWCYMLEPNWAFHTKIPKYVAKIKKLKVKQHTPDKTVFIFNKIDMSNVVFSPGQVNMKALRREITGLYSGLLEAFQKDSLFFGKTDNFRLVPFQTGDYSTAADGTKAFDIGPNEYPRALWNELYRLIKG